MPARLIAWLQAATEWAAVLPVAILALLALAMALLLPRAVWAKSAWAAAVLVCAVGCAGLALVDVQLHEGLHERARQSMASDEIAALHGLWDSWDKVSQSLPGAEEKPAAAFDTVEDALASLEAQVPAIERQIAVAREPAKGRVIGEDTAAKLADYLRQFGSFPVVVSCVPDDTEAFLYANQLVNILRAAGWDARGPELTTQRPAATGMGITVLAHDPQAPAAAKIVLDAFARFNIPVQSGIAGAEDIPDPVSIELFVPKKS
jgi:hypothetical protein